MLDTCLRHTPQTYTRNIHPRHVRKSPSKTLPTHGAIQRSQLVKTSKTFPRSLLLIFTPFDLRQMAAADGSHPSSTDLNPGHPSSDSDEHLHSSSFQIGLCISQIRARRDYAEKYLKEVLEWRSLAVHGFVSRRILSSNTWLMLRYCSSAGPYPVKLEYQSELYIPGRSLRD